MVFKCLRRYWCKQPHCVAVVSLFISAHKNWWGVNADLTGLCIFCTLSHYFQVSSCLLEKRSYGIVCSIFLTTASLNCAHHFSWVHLISMEGDLTCIISNLKHTDVVVTLWSCWIILSSEWNPVGKLNGQFSSSDLNAVVCKSTQPPRSLSHVFLCLLWAFFIIPLVNLGIKTCSYLYYCVHLRSLLDWDQRFLNFEV